MVNKNMVVQAYNADWQKKINEDTRLFSQERVISTFLNLFDKILDEKFSGKILDVGCGDGALVKVLNSHNGINAQGVDIHNGGNFETEPLAYPDNEFDIVIMYSVIEHIHNPGNILNEIKRILKNTGILIVITSNVDFSNLIICERSFYNDPTHIHPYNTTSIQHLMRLYGFQKKFLGLWTVKKSFLIWRMPMSLQFYLGAFLPFKGNVKGVPDFLKGKSKTFLGAFKNVK